MLRFGWLSPYLFQYQLTQAPPKEGPECEIQQQKEMSPRLKLAHATTPQQPLSLARAVKWLCFAKSRIRRSVFSLC